MTNRANHSNKQSYCGKPPQFSQGRKMNVATGIATLVIPVLAIFAGVVNPEIRCSFRLQSESCPGSIASPAEDFYQEGSKHLELERNREALKYFEQAIELDPKQAKVWNKHGVASEKLDKNQQALSSYEKALLIDPTYELARQNREALLLKQKQLRSQVNHRE